MEARGSASLEWLINGLHLSYSQLTAPQMKWRLIHLHAKTPFSTHAFPQSSIFHGGVSMRSFLPRFSPDGHHSQAVKLLNCSLAPTVSTVTQLADWSSDRMHKWIRKRAGQCSSSLMLSLSVATPKSFCSLVFHLHSSACLLCALFFNDHIRQGQHSGLEVPCAYAC